MSETVLPHAMRSVVSRVVGQRGVVEIKALAVQQAADAETLLHISHARGVASFAGTLATACQVRA